MKIQRISSEEMFEKETKVIWLVECDVMLELRQEENRGLAGANYVIKN